MLRTFRLTIAAAAALALTAPGARAQLFYPGGYGGFGWGGWGGGGTVYGNNMKGLGAFAAGAGVYNQQTAVANSINADTVMRWNEYLYESQRVATQRYYENLARQQKQTRENYDAIRKRVRHDPTQRDILQGDALNELLDEITAPGAYNTAMQLARRPVKGEVVREIPFIYASSPLVFSVDELREDWPTSLRGPRFKDAEAEFAKKVDEIKAKVAKGDLTDEDIKPALAALKKVYDIFIADPPKDGVVISRTREFLRTLGGVLQLLRTPDFAEVLKQLKDIDETTVGDMIAFMHAFNLRFGPASTPRQRELYLQRVYPTLRTLADEHAKSNAVAEARPVPEDLPPPPSAALSPLPDETLIEGKGVPPAPAPKR